jgi:ferredoxin-NADP reductase
VRGPRNHFGLEPVSEYVFVSGGMGITPIRAMIETVENGRDPWRLHYGGHSLAHMAVAEELQYRYGDRVSLVAKTRNGMPDLTSLIARSAP